MPLHAMSFVAPLHSGLAYGPGGGFWAPSANTAVGDGGGSSAGVDDGLGGAGRRAGSSKRRRGSSVHHDGPGDRPLDPRAKRTQHEQSSDGADASDHEGMGEGMERGTGDDASGHAGTFKTQILASSVHIRACEGADWMSSIAVLTTSH